MNDENKVLSFLKGLANEKYFKMMGTPRKFIFYNFLGGLVKGLGFAIGTTIIFALLIWFLSKLSIIPVLGNWINSLLDYINKVR